MSDQLIVWGTKDLNTSAQLVLAKRLGFFKQAGLDVQCKLFPSEQRLAEAFRQAGEKPFVWAQTVPEFLRLYASGREVKIIAPLADISASYQVILREDAGIVLPGELEGRKIGIVRGSLIEVAFRNMAKDFGVDFAKIQFIDVSPTKQLELFVDGELDGIACWEPWTSQARYMGGKLYFSGLHSLIPGHEGNVNWLTGQSMLVTFAETIRTFPERLLTLLQSVKKATDYLNTTIHKAAFILSDLLGMPNEELAVLLQKNIYTMKMDALFQVGLVSICDTFLTMEAPDKLEPARRSLPSAEMYVAHLLKQLDPLLIQLADDKLAAEPHASSPELEMAGENNIYYPAHGKMRSAGARRPGAAPRRYLIVDDTRVVTDLFAVVVEMVNGVVVGTSATGAEAIIQYVDLLPEIVVMDISMPDMNGIEAIKRIFAINPTADIIVLSGNNYAEIRREVFALGVKLFIGKPFHVEQVAKVLAKLLEA